jgi:diadenosine tetraphosphate (Ap4A) HIT family hydrolase
LDAVFVYIHLMSNCVLCKDTLSPEEGELIWRGDDCRVILIQDPDLPGFCRVIWNRHVSEMSELTYGEREHLMNLVFAVEQAIDQTMEPLKINLASLGNQVPHLHWHVIPRYEDDAFFPSTAWSARIRETPTTVIAQRQKRAAELPKAIRAAIAGLA